MNLDLDAIRANAAEDDDDTVDYDLIIQLAEKWVEDHPSEKPPRNDIADKMEELVAASDGSGLVRDAVIDALVARWSSLKVPIVATVHDELVIDCSADQQSVRAVRRILKAKMTRAWLEFFPDAPFRGVVDITTGPSWGQQEESSP